MSDTVSTAEAAVDTEPTASRRILVDLIGFTATMALLNAKGGQRIYVPENEAAHGSRMLVQIVGEACAAALRLKFGGTAIDIPIGPSQTGSDPLWERHLLPRGWRDKVSEGVDDIEGVAVALAGHLVERFEGHSFLHIKALTERAVALIGARVVVCPRTVFIPEAEARRPPSSSE